MNAILLTVLALGGNGAAYYGGPTTQAPVDGGAYAGECDQCAGGGRHGHHGEHQGLLGTMPQSCYDPSFGCYTSSRHMQRYPAFHGTFYRRAYNYRNYFDYPWHAGLHEPTSHFSYHVPGEQPTEVVPAPQPEPPVASFLPRPAYRPTVRQTTVADDEVPMPTPRKVYSQFDRTSRATVESQPTLAQPRSLAAVIESAKVGLPLATPKAEPTPAAKPQPLAPVVEAQEAGPTPAKPLAPIVESSELRKLPR